MRTPAETPGVVAGRMYPGVSMTARPPVSDWATDWDHLDPAWTTDPYRIWDGLRQQCPVAHTERYKGVYFPTRYQDIRDIA